MKEDLQLNLDAFLPLRAVVFNTLRDAILRGEGRTLTPRETLEEIRLLLEHLEAEPLHFTSNHASNYLPLKGGLPEDRERLLALVNGALSGQVEVRPEFRRGL